VKQALAELGYSVTEGTVRGYRGNLADADLIVQINDAYDIGFRQEADQIVMVADFWGLRIDKESFLKTLSQKYAYLTIMEQAQSQGWQAMNEELQSDGSIRLIMQRWS
jgi:hypothetical protein